MITFLSSLLDTSGFPPRWMCGSSWTNELGWIHILSDLSIASAYFTIAYSLFYFTKIKKRVPFIRVFFLFSAFIFFCGLVHLVDSFVFWHPLYRLLGLIKIITAVVSTITAFYLFKVIPKALSYPEKVYGLKHLSQIIESAHDGIISIDLNGYIKTWNKAAEKILGFKKEEIVGKHMSCIANCSEEEYDNRLAMLVAIHGEKNYEVKRRHKLGYEVDIISSTFPLRDDFGKIIGLCGIFKSITKEKQLQNLLHEKIEQLAKANLVLSRKREALKALNKQLYISNQALEEKNKDLKSFTYIASHDLRSPIRAITNLSEWLLEDLGDKIPISSQRHLLALKTRAQRMEKLLDDLLTYVRVGSEKIEPEEVNTHELIQDTIKIIDKPQDFMINVRGHLPIFITHRVPLQQIFYNLINNSIKHHHSPQTGEINISYSSSEYFYHFTVQDNGPGIPPAYHKKIFNKFETLKSKDEVEGSGIGLAIVKKLVEKYGGTITIHSNGKDGSSFTFSWPIDVNAEIREDGHKYAQVIEN